MKTIKNSGESKHEWESTYALLVPSEEKNRNLPEVTINPLLAAAGFIAICQFALQTIEVPSTRGEGDPLHRCMWSRAQRAEESTSGSYRPLAEI